jgi:hypothetical protein
MDLEVILPTQAQGSLLVVDSRQIEYKKSSEKKTYEPAFL